MASEKAVHPVLPLPEAPGSAELARPRLFVLSDIRLLCEGLLLALSHQPSVSVLGSADLSAPPSEIAKRGPDVLLLDLTSSGGLDLAVPLRQAMPKLKIIAIAVSEVEEDVIACAEAGISGFVSRNGSTEEVLAAVHAAMRGEILCSPRATALIVSRMASLAAASSAPGALTRREQEIAMLMGEGLSNKEIARALKIQNATVKNHIHSILGKLRVRRRGEAAAQLRRLNLCGMGHPSASRPTAAATRLPAV